MKLYSYWRSSAAYRVRIALNLKGLDYEIAPVHMLKDGGEQRQADYLAVNPQGLIPTLEDGDLKLGQSLAIMDYLEAKHPEPALYPQALEERALAQQLALAIACDIHPLNNLRALKYLKNDLGVEEDAARDSWYRHWIRAGFGAMETLLRERGWRGPYCLDQQVTLADACLVPQMYNARRFETPLDDFPILTKIDAACLELPAFQQAAPENQTDAAT